MKDVNAFLRWLGRMSVGPRSLFYCSTRAPGLTCPALSHKTHSNWTRSSGGGRGCGRNIAGERGAGVSTSKLHTCAVRRAMVGPLEQASDGRMGGALHITRCPNQTAPPWVVGI